MNENPKERRKANNDKKTEKEKDETNNQNERG